MKKENIDFSIDDIKLDTENKEFQDALDIVQYTNNIIYLTGKAGTGKTHFLNIFVKLLTSRWSYWRLQELLL